MANKEQIIIDPLYDVTTNLASNPIYIKAYSQDSADYGSASDQKVVWDGSFFGNKITHSTTTDNTKFFIEETGKYFLSSSFTCEGDINGIRESMAAKIFVNGVALSERSLSYLRDAANTFYCTTTITSIIDLTANDYIEIAMSSLGGSGTVYNLSDETIFSLYKLGGENVNENNVVTITDVINITNSDSPYIASWEQDIEVDCSSGAVTIEMPPASSNNGKTISVTKVDNTANKVTITPYSTETINGNTSDEIAYQWTSYTYKSNGSNLTIR